MGEIPQISRFKQVTDKIRTAKWGGMRDLFLTIPPFENVEENFSGTEIVFLEHPGNRTQFEMTLSEGEPIHMPDPPIVLTIWQHPYSKIRFYNLTNAVRTVKAILANVPFIMEGDLK